jgi:hypothetical protein
MIQFKESGNASEVKGRISTSEFNEQKYGDDLRADVQAVKEAMNNIAGLAGAGCAIDLQAEVHLCSVGVEKGTIVFELKRPQPVQAPPVEPPVDPPSTDADPGAETIVPDGATVTAGDADASATIPDGGKVEVSDEPPAEGTDAPVQ